MPTANTPGVKDNDSSAKGDITGKQPNPAAVAPDNMQSAEQAKAQDKEEEKEAGKRWTALHPIHRNGETVHPGDEVSFDKSEGAHVMQLEGQGVIIEGGSGTKAVKEALAREQEKRDRLLRGHLS